MTDDGRIEVLVERVKDLSGDGEIRSTLRGMLDRVGAGIRLSPGGTAVVKLNLCLLKGPETGATVDPRVAACLAEWLFARGAGKVLLAESDATHLSADLAFQILGWRDFFKGVPGVELFNLSRDETVTVKARHLGELAMSRTMMEAGLLVSLAKLKTHTREKITGIMKNQFGAIPYKYKVVYHPRLTEAIVDATAARPPELCLVDGLVAMEGNGPTNGIPRRTGLLVASRDAVATDHCLARLMGFRPRSVPHVALALKEGLGSADYRLAGSPPEPLDLGFKFLPAWKAAVKGCLALVARGRGDGED